jgi:PKD repeat protein
LIGAATVTVQLGAVYTDAGATATDNVDGDISDRITVVNPVDTSIAGTYTVSYSVEDNAGNSASATRTVIVESAPPPPPPPRSSGGGGATSIWLLAWLTGFACRIAVRRAK